MADRQRVSLYALARACFWALPAPMRTQLHGVRHVLARWLRRRKGAAVPEGEDLDWAAFQRAALQGTEAPRIIIFETNTDWGILLFQRPQHMALALGRIGCVVIFKTTGDGVVGFREVARNVWLANDRAVPAIPGAVHCFYSTSLLASAADMQAARRHGPVVYEYVDHIDASISGGRAAMRRLQTLKKAAFEGAADLVVASATALYDEAVQQRGFVHCACIRNGVDVMHYREAPRLDVIPQEAFRAFRAQHRRIVGYFGAIAPWLWFDILDKISAQMADVGFVFIGPDYSGCVPRLPQRSNVLYLGAIPYTDLPAYGCLFDACFIPFSLGDVARSTSPLKLYEYFALEKPVVVTADMRECVAYPEVFSGGNAEELVAALERALARKNDTSFRAKLGALADANSWDVRATAYVAALSRLDDA